ncbi:MAG: DUF1761 domain-containing protein [Saprospiraceae bacterium]
MNILAQVLAALSALLVGFLWYHPKTFGTAWMRGIGMTEEKMASGNMAVRYGLAFVLAFIISLFVAYFGSSHEEKVLTPFQHSTFHGAQLAVVMVMPILVIVSLFEKLDFKTIAINVGYWLVTLTAMGAIIGGMGSG